jgi:hypothetical protein
MRKLNVSSKSQLSDYILPAFGIASVVPTVGYHNTGIGLTGDNLVGVGPFSISG